MTTYLIGSDGSATFPDGYVVKFNTFSATATRASQVVTAFGDTSQRRRLSSVLDITGSAGGTPMKDVADSNPFGITGDGITGNGTDAIAITLTFASGCTLGFDAVVNSASFSVTQDSTQTATFNFEMDDANGPTIAWDDS